MHELSSCETIAEIVCRHAGGRPVVSVQIQVGHLRQVVPDALAFGWTMTVQGTPLGGVRLSRQVSRLGGTAEQQHPHP